MQKIIFITGNKEKLEIAKAAAKGSSFEIISKDINCPELQEDDTSSIAKYSAKFASDKLKENVVKIDSGLFIEALNGFPGPYSNYVERKLDAKDILELMKNKKNRRAYYKESLAFCEFNKEAIVFESFTEGEISSELSGIYGLNFDRIFIVKGDIMTMANLDDKERIKRYTNENWKKLIEFLKNEIENKK